MMKAANLKAENARAIQFPCRGSVSLPVFIFRNRRVREGSYGRNFDVIFHITTKQTLLSGTK
jgi:hypothetical protein